MRLCKLLRYLIHVHFLLSRFYKISVLVMCFLLPTMVPWYFWGESLWNSYFLASILRYTISLNITWLVNSAAHMYGNRPYNRNINPRENQLVTFGTFGIFVFFLPTSNVVGVCAWPFTVVESGLFNDNSSY